MNGAPQGLPLPGVTRTTEPFWKGCSEHKLMVQRCAKCGTYRHSPAPLCGHCQSSEHGWEQSRGAGTIYSYMVAHHAVHPSLKDQVPYAVVVVKLDDCGGACMISNLAGVDVGKIGVGMQVKVAWEDVGRGMTLHRFVLA